MGYIEEVVGYADQQNCLFFCRDRKSEEMKDKIYIGRKHDVFILQMRDGENRFNEEFIRQFNTALDEVEKSEGAAALIITGEDKFFSNGLDLTWLSENIEKAESFFRGFHHLLNRVLTLPVLTIAAINGHVYAGGAMLALACDFRFMRQDKGFFCLPEIDINAPLTPGMTALISAKMPQPVLRDSILLGQKYDSRALLENRLIDGVYPIGELLVKCLELGEKISTKAMNRETLGALKKEMYNHASRLLLENQLGFVTLPKL